MTQIGIICQGLLASFGKHDSSNLNSNPPDLTIAKLLSLKIDLKPIPLNPIVSVLSRLSPWLIPVNA